ncbi:hypothetical protein K438DRAFT_1597807 [Mycena galopus ATCC 62051]|nr:hypothetical protein K438DRAFT_1597807 [Mycena galopus ATCC 62051]
MWNGTRFYIGEILDVYKKGANSRYGSVSNSPSITGTSFLSMRIYLPLLTGNESDSDDEEDVETLVAPAFSCHYKGTPIRLHTHAKIDHLLSNLGPRISLFFFFFFFFFLECLR